MRQYHVYLDQTSVLNTHIKGINLVSDQEKLKGSGLCLRLPLSQGRTIQQNRVNDSYRRKRNLLLSAPVHVQLIQKQLCSDDSCILQQLQLMQKQSHDLEEGQRAKARKKSPGLQTSDERYVTYSLCCTYEEVSTWRG